MRFWRAFGGRLTAARRMPSVWCGARNAAVRTASQEDFRCADRFLRDLAAHRPPGSALRVVRLTLVRPALCCPCPFFRACCVQTFAPGLAGASVRVRPCARSAPAALCVLDLDGVRVAAAAVDDAAGDDDLVALFELHDGTADLQRMVKQHVGALVYLTHDGRDAP